ncbi:hypothetical protein EIP86_000811 [Pleurotus ostreatoroseus]|nr:hypothetical protein EIP86_000811 [Pleurotus ostreatoroseus]
MEHMLDSLENLLDEIGDPDCEVEYSKWIYAREQRSLGQLLNSELSKILKQDVDLGVDHPPSTN